MLFAKWHNDLIFRNKVLNFKLTIQKLKEIFEDYKNIYLKRNHHNPDYGRK